MRNCTKCGEKLHGRTKGEVCRGCRAANGSSAAGGGRRRQRSNGRVKEDEVLMLTVPATAEICQQRWDELTLREKVAALNAVSESVER